MSNPITIAYGPGKAQFGQLWLPVRSGGSASVPPASVPPTSVPPTIGPSSDLPGGEPKSTGGTQLVVLLHGGFWRHSYDLSLMDPLAKDLVERGFAVWNVEYRRVGEPGGGFPGTLNDVAAAIDRLAGLATTYGFDATSVTAVGHSAGGQLALWAAGRQFLPPGTPGSNPKVVLNFAIGQGPVVDLRLGADDGLGNGAIVDFLGGSFDAYPDRYATATPLATPGVRAAIVVADADDIVPRRYSAPDTIDASKVQVVDVPGDHFALIDPRSKAWSRVVELIYSSHDPKSAVPTT